VPGGFALYAGNLDGYQELAMLAAAAALAETPIAVATHGAGRAPAPLCTLRIADAGALRPLTHGAAACALTRRATGGFPIKLLNYMEAGRAIVALASIADPLRDGVSGRLLSDAASPADWAGAIDALAADPATAARLGAAARAVLAREHDPGHGAERLLRWIESLCEATAR
jgi:glycosyltransferase involved in cell wall biosynthesis